MSDYDVRSEKHDPPGPPNVPDSSAARNELLRALAICFIAVILVRSFVFELFKIPSSSMVPTLKIGDHIVVSKFNYGLTFPFTSWEFVSWSAPKRGDVVVFIYPKDESLYYIKRVVGVPGDKISFKGKDLYINGEPVPKEPIADPAEVAKVMGTDGRSANQLTEEEQQEASETNKLFRENLNGVSHLVRHSDNTAYAFSDGAEAHEVAPDHFYVMGDNRDSSYDSRSWGDVPRKNLRGKAQLIWISLRKVPWNSWNKVRWSRAMTLIH